MGISVALQIQEENKLPSNALNDVSMTYSYDSISRSVVAGYMAGVCGVVIGHPLDSLKVFLQTDGPCSSASNRITTSPAKSVSKGIAHMSTLAAPMKPRDLSIRALYAGVSGPLMTVGLVQSINFCIYDSMRRILHRRDHPLVSDTDYLRHDSIFNVALSSMISGSILSFITSPMLIVKTKQQVMTWSFSHAVRDTLKRRNRPAPLNFFVGFGPHFLSETIGRSIYFATYEQLKRDLTGADSHASLPQRMLAAGAAGVLCWSVIFPFDVLRSRIYAMAITMDPANAWDMTKSMYREGAWRPFYRGFGITVLRAGPVSAAVLPVYDSTLEWLNQ